MTAADHFSTVVTLCAQPTRDRLAIAMFLVSTGHRLLPPEVKAFARVRLSVCLSLSKIIQKRVHGFG